MAEPVFINGKAHLDYCYLCNESKAAIKHSQRNTNNPIYCGAVDYWGECLWEADHHVFVITEKAYLADKQSETEWFAAHGVDIEEELKNAPWPPKE